MSPVWQPIVDANFPRPKAGHDFMVNREKTLLKFQPSIDYYAVL